MLVLQKPLLTDHATKSNLSWTDNKGVNHTCESSGRCGTGGFLPFGLYGVIQGSARCFYAFIGFDSIASTGEEVVNPKRNIPLAIMLTLLICSILYIGISLELTLMIPYYQIDVYVPFPQAFSYVGLNWASVVVSVGACATLLTWFKGFLF
jgi:cationic amino acid transporter 3